MARRKKRGGSKARRRDEAVLVRKLHIYAELAAALPVTETATENTVAFPRTFFNEGVQGTTEREIHYTGNDNRRCRKLYSTHVPVRTDRKVAGRNKK